MKLKIEIRSINAWRRKKEEKKKRKRNEMDEKKDGDKGNKIKNK